MNVVHDIWRSPTETALPGDKRQPYPGVQAMRLFLRFLIACCGFFVALSTQAYADLAIDAVVSGTERTQLHNGDTFASNAFSTTSPNELILALVQLNASLSFAVSTSSLTGAGLTWVLVGRWNKSDDNSVTSCAEVWRAFATSPITSQTLTGTVAVPSANPAYGVITVISFSGVDSSGTNGSGAIGAVSKGGSGSGTPSQSLTTTRANSWVVGSLFNWTSTTLPVAGTAQTIFGAIPVLGGGYYWSQRKNAVTPTAGTVVTINDTAPTSVDYAAVILEVLPAIEPPSGFIILQ